MFNQALISKRDKKRFAKTRRRRTKEGCCQIYWITRIFRIFSTKGKQSVGFFGTSEVEISPYFNFDLLLLVLRDLGNDFWRHAWNRVLIPCDAIGCYDWISERECERLLLGKDWFSDRWGLSLVVLNSQFRLLSFWDEKCALPPPLCMHVHSDWWVLPTKISDLDSCLSEVLLFWLVAKQEYYLTLILPNLYFSFRVAVIQKDEVHFLLLYLCACILSIPIGESCLTNLSDLDWCPSERDPLLFGLSHKHIVC